MSDDPTQVTSEAAIIMEKMVQLEKDEPRYQILKATLDYKASWLELAERLNVIADNKEYKEWGYKTFKDYSLQELHLAQTTARKLVRGYQWIDQEAPEFLPRFVESLGEGQAPPVRAVPDVDTIDVLVSAQRELANDRLSGDQYAELKQKALQGEGNARELKKQMREALPEPDVEAGEQIIRVLRKTLSATERIIAQLEELGDDDGELMTLASTLRDRVFALVSARLDEQAYLDGGGASEG